MVGTRQKRTNTDKINRQNRMTVKESGSNYNVIQVLLHSTHYTSQKRNGKSWCTVLSEYTCDLKHSHCSSRRCVDVCVASISNCDVRVLTGGGCDDEKNVIKRFSVIYMFQSSDYHFLHNSFSRKAVRSEINFICQEIGNRN